MKTYRILIFLILWFNFFKAENSDLLISEFNSYMHESISKANIAGMGIAILTKDSAIFKKGYGYSNVKTKDLFTPNTVMNIASISKTFIGVSIMYLVEKEKVKLDDDINKFLPFKVSNPFFPDSIITLRHLMSHTSGIIDNNKIYPKYYNYGDDSPISLEIFLKDYLTPNGRLFNKNNFTKKNSGLEFNYSNIGAGLAGLIVEKISDKPFNIFTNEIIFKPLNMNNTCWFLSEMDRFNHSRLYKSQFFNLFQKEIDLYGLCTYPDGGLRTSINDLSKYLLYIANNGKNEEEKILFEETIHTMLTVDYVKHYTKFWEILGSDGFGHGGGDPGVRTGMYYNYKKNIGIIFFINTHPHGEFENMINQINKFAIKLNALIKG
tara:strand:- start:2340 stop:3473 length:1134 start_codon:yes stop_codon:yes gene_type:complete